MATEINYTPIEEGDNITAASLQTRFVEIENGFADFPRDSLDVNALRHEHLPSFIPESPSPLNGGESLDITASFALALGAAVPAVITDGVTPLEFNWFPSTVLLGMSNILSKVSSILVLFNVQFQNLEPVNPLTTLEFRIQYANALGVWTDIPRTNREVARYAPDADTLFPYQSLSIYTLIKPSDTAILTGIRAVAESSTAFAYTLKNARITIIPFHSSEVS